jgi:hypothetical protein
MSKSTRFLLGGYYGAAVVSLILPLRFRRQYLLPWEHDAQFFLQAHRLELALLLSLAVCLIALLWVNHRLLALAAAGINASYAVGGVSLFAWFIAVPGGFGLIRAEDAYIFLCVIYVPVVAAISFFHSYRVKAPNNRFNRDCGAGNFG